MFENPYIKFTWSIDEIIDYPATDTSDWSQSRLNKAREDYGFQVGEFICCNLDEVNDFDELGKPVVGINGIVWKGMDGVVYKYYSNVDLLDDEWWTNNHLDSTYYKAENYIP